MYMCVYSMYYVHVWTITVFGGSLTCTSFSRHCGGCFPDLQTPWLASYLRYWQYIEQVSLECCADNIPPSFSPFTSSASPSYLPSLPSSSLPPPTSLSFFFFLRHIFLLLLFSFLPLLPPFSSSIISSPSYLSLTAPV